MTKIKNALPASGVTNRIRGPHTEVSIFPIACVSCLGGLVFRAPLRYAAVRQASAGDIPMDINPETLVERTRARLCQLRLRQADLTAQGLLDQVADLDALLGRLTLQYVRQGGRWLNQRVLIVEEPEQALPVEAILAGIRSEFGSRMPAELVLDADRFAFCCYTSAEFAPELTAWLESQGYGKVRVSENPHPFIGGLSTLAECQRTLAAYAARVPSAPPLSDTA